MSRKPVPDRDAPVVDAQGRITPSWLEYFRDLDQRAPTQKISTTSPTNGQVLIYNSTTGLYTPGTN